MSLFIYRLMKSYPFEHIAVGLSLRNHGRNSLNSSAAGLAFAVNVVLQPTHRGSVSKKYNIHVCDNVSNRNKENILLKHYNCHF